MPEPLYFQWQNEILLKTIYPFVMHLTPIYNRANQ